MLYALFREKSTRSPIDLLLLTLTHLTKAPTIRSSNSILIQIFYLILIL